MPDLSFALSAQKRKFSFSFSDKSRSFSLGERVYSCFAHFILFSSSFLPSVQISPFSPRAVCLCVQNDVQSADRELSNLQFCEHLWANSYYLWFQRSIDTSFAEKLQSICKIVALKMQKNTLKCINCSQMHKTAIIIRKMHSNAGETALHCRKLNWNCRNLHLRCKK